MVAAMAGLGGILWRLREPSGAKLSVRYRRPGSGIETAAAEEPKSPPPAQGQAASSTVTTRRFLKRAKASSSLPILVAWRGSSMRRTSLS